jgi:ketosteroid isomerase-like protein
MRWFRPTVLAALVCASAVSSAQETADEHLDSLVDVEKAFSALSVEKGMKVAFLAYLADDGILFRPAPVPGRKSWQSRPNPPGTLIWEPSYAEVSAFGDLGLSTGPWEFRPPDGTQGEIGYGQFVSVWRRMDEEGPWMVAVDLGVSHPKPSANGFGNVRFEAGPEHQLPPPPKSGGPGFSFGGSVFGGGGGIGIGVGSLDHPYDDNAKQAMAHQLHRMMSTERRLAYELRSKDPGKAWPKLTTADVRVLRNGNEPVVGMTPGLELAATTRLRGMEFRPYGHGLAGALDMGYSYGIALRTKKGASKPDTSGYMHVWRRDGSGEWKLSLDVESSYPRR